MGTRNRKLLLTIGVVLLLAASCTMNIRRDEDFAGLPTTLPTPTTAPAVMAGFSYPAAMPQRQRKNEDIPLMNAACVACHAVDSHTMHETTTSRATCVDCHGGNPNFAVPDKIASSDPEYQRFKRAAHVHPKMPDLWKSSANPEVPGAATLNESLDYIRFVNPGDLRVADASCGVCHADVTAKVKKNMMSHGG